MTRLTASSVTLIVLQSVIAALANVKITPIAVENKSNMKTDLKVEEARYQNPIAPEYYGGGYDRNRDNFVTSAYDAYGSGLSNYDRSGYKYGYGYDRYGTNSGTRYGVNTDRYGGIGGSSMYNRDKVGTNYGNPLENRVNYMPGGVYPTGSTPGYGSRYPYEGGSASGPYPMPGAGGLFPHDLEKSKSLLIPLAGAALLGIAAYTIFANPGLAMGPSLMGPGLMGKRRKRSLFDEKLEQHLAYRAYQNKIKGNTK